MTMAPSVSLHCKNTLRIKQFLMICALVLGALFFFAPEAAYAQTAGAACSMGSNGGVDYNGGRMYGCSSSRNALFLNANTSGGACGTGGYLQDDTTYGPEYCNGSNWARIAIRAYNYTCSSGSWVKGSASDTRYYDSGCTSGIYTSGTFQCVTTPTSACKTPATYYTYTCSIGGTWNKGGSGCSLSCSTSPATTGQTRCCASTPTATCTASYSLYRCIFGSGGTNWVYQTTCSGPDDFACEDVGGTSANKEFACCDGHEPYSCCDDGKALCLK